MTEIQIEDFFKRRKSIEELKVQIRQSEDFISKQDMQNNLSCDHTYPEGSRAVGGNYICAICGCGASLN